MAPLNVFNCVQKTLGGTSGCLGCVCDIVKPFMPLLPCNSGDITINADGEINADGQVTGSGTNTYMFRESVLLQFYVYFNHILPIQELTLEYLELVEVL